MNYKKDVDFIKDRLNEIPNRWDGKESILELKEIADKEGIKGQWKQMEWIGFYFEHLCNKRLKYKNFEMLGKKYDNVEFDSFGCINWDMKSSAITSHTHRIILNDKIATAKSIEEFGKHGIILALIEFPLRIITRQKLCPPF